MKGPGNLLPLGLVFSAVCLNVLSAVVLKSMADAVTIALPLLAAGLGIVIGINALRVVIWGYAHRNFALSRTYPISALFFPIIALVSYIYGEVVSWPQLAGAAMIVIGVVLLTTDADPA